MSATATIAEIAARAGVGTATVDRVLNKPAGRQPRDRAARAAGGRRDRRAAAARPAAARRQFPLRVRAAGRRVAVPRPGRRARSRRPPATSATSTSPRSPTASTTADATQFADAARAGRRLRRRRADGARRAAGQARDQRARAHRRPCRHALLRCAPARCARPIVGADNRAAGRTAGLLLARMARTAGATRCCSPRRRRACRPRSSAASASRRCSRSASRSCACCACPTCRPTTTARGARCGRFLKKGVDPARVAGLYNVGSGSAGVARALDDAGLAGLVGMAAHDLTDEHRALLSSGGFAYRAAPGHPLLRAGGGARAARAVRERSRGTQRGAAAHRDPDGREPALSSDARRMCALNPT